MAVYFASTAFVLASFFAYAERANRLALALATCATALVVGVSVLRVGISSDYWWYADFYEAFGEGFEEFRTEPGWTVLNVAFRRATGAPFQIFIASLFVLVFLLKYYSYSRAGLPYRFYLLYYVVAFWLLLDLGPLRRSLALAVCLFAYFTYSRRPLIRAGLYALAGCFHASALCMLALDPLAGALALVTRRSHRLFLFACMLGTALLLRPYVGEIFSFVGQERADATLGSAFGQSESIFSVGLMTRLAVILLVLSRKEIDRKDWLFALYAPVYLVTTSVSSLLFLAMFPRIAEPLVLWEGLSQRRTSARFVLCLVVLLGMASLFFDPMVRTEYGYRWLGD